MSEREHAAAPVNTAFDPGCRRRRPRGSFAAASAVAPIARAPASAPTRNITTKKSGAAGDITIVRPTAAAPTRRRVRVSLQVEMRRAGFSATTRQGIKNTISPAGNVGERARRRQRPLSHAVSIRSWPSLPHSSDPAPTSKTKKKSAQPSQGLIRRSRRPRSAAPGRPASESEPASSGVSGAGF